MLLVPATTIRPHAHHIDRNDNGHRHQLARAIWRDFLRHLREIVTMFPEASTSCGSSSN